MGVYLSIISGAIKLFNTIAQRLQQHHDEMNGATQQREVTNDATVKTLESVAAPISGADSDKLWELNKAKFGADYRGTGD